MFILFVFFVSYGVISNIVRNLVYESFEIPLFARDDTNCCLRLRLRLQTQCHKLLFFLLLTNCREEVTMRMRKRLMLQLWYAPHMVGIKKEGRHPDDQSSNFKNLIP